MQKEVTKTKLVTYCDFCERKIKPVKRRCGECFNEIEMLPIYRTRVWDTRKLFPELCENCAGKLDRALSLMQHGLTCREMALRRYAELNRIRRAELGSDG